MERFLKWEYVANLAVIGRIKRLGVDSDANGSLGRSSTCARAYVSYSRLRFKNFNLSFSGVANWQWHGVMDLIE